MEKTKTRPLINEYQDPSAFVRDMIQYRKSASRGFSVSRATRRLRKVSPTLVSLVCQGKRSLTVDRADEFAKLMDLNSSEKTIFKNWIGQLEGVDFLEDKEKNPPSRKDVAVSLLTDWINVYVKDFFQMPAVQKDPARIEQLLRAVATPQRIQRALQFLLSEGYLRKTLDGTIVPETRLSVAEPKAPSRKIRQFHKAALQLARVALDLYPVEERRANTLTISLDEERLDELNALIDEFGERLRDFAARNPNPGNRLYQLIINLSPIGGKLE